jgi:tRNA pseudouridine13 synthase
MVCIAYKTNNMPTTNHTDPSSLPYAWGGPAGQARLRVEPEDFQVTEIPVCLPEGQGEHLWLRVRKRDSNTEWVAKQLARWAGVGPAQVSYAGLKDRHAVTEQWFSIQLPGQPDPDPTVLTSNEFHVEEMARHSRKLKRGALKGNRFVLRLHDWRGDRELLEERLQRIASGGVPNYFGDQRFGHDGGNLEQARRLFAGELRKCPRHQRGLYLSAARSWLFNKIASLRVADGSWNQALPGDFLQLDGRHAGFVAEADDDELAARLIALDVHPTGPLWGRGRPQTGEPRTDWESEQLAPYRDWCGGLERAGLEQERRALRVRVEDLRWEWQGTTSLCLAFSLGAGSYATMVVRELVDTLQ